MFRKLIVVLVALLAVTFLAFWVLSTPRSISAAQLPQHTADIANGQLIFWAGMRGLPCRRDRKGRRPA